MLENLSDKEKEVLDIIRTVIDPEVALNIVDLGLIYDVNYEEDKKHIHVLATLSARGCPVGDTILNHIDTVIRANYPNFTVDVELTWEPEWTPEFISEAGKAALEGM